MVEGDIEIQAPLLEAVDLTKAFGDRLVLDVERFAVSRGEILVVLGPSGAGKSVFLRILNLLEPPTSGRVMLAGTEIQGLEGRGRVEVSRRMALIFQDPLLFRGTVGENVAYGLKVRGVPAEVRAARAAAMLRIVKLDGLEDRYVTTLSGGEAQRVALARALVIEPEVILLDEPFASLDAPTRRDLQEEVRELLHRLGMTAVFVTHDQDEAARLADRMVLLNEGRIVQQGSPRDIFYQPSGEFAAGFIGFENIYDGEVVSSEEGLAHIDVGGHRIEAVADLQPGERVKVGLRPEDVSLTPAPCEDELSSARNRLPGRVAAVDLRGPVARVTIECPFQLVAVVTRRSLEELGLDVGSQVEARFKATAVVVIER